MSGAAAASASGSSSSHSGSVEDDVNVDDGSDRDDEVDDDTGDMMNSSSRQHNSHLQAGTRATANVAAAASALSNLSPKLSANMTPHTPVDGMLRQLHTQQQSKQNVPSFELG